MTFREARIFLATAPVLSPVPNYTAWRPRHVCEIALSRYMILEQLEVNAATSLYRESDILTVTSPYHFNTKHKISFVQ